jgi:phosphoglycolate phosphatase
MSSFKHDLLLFDLDGTLSDPIEGISRSINYSLTYFGFQAREVKELAAYIGPPLEQAFRELTGISEDAELRAFIAKYRERYAEVGFSENVLYPGIVEMLQYLHEARVPMAVCTSKREDFARCILELFEIGKYFLFVNGGEIGIRKWQQIEILVAQQKISQSSLMIGDRAVDLIAAHKNRLQSACVLWGYGSETELFAEKPDYVFRSPAELLSLVD